MMDHASNERPFSLWPERPLVSKELALSLVQKYFDLEVVEVKELDSYQDRNFYLKTIQKHEDHENIEFVLKILNYVDSAIEGMVEAQSAAMLFLKDKGLVCPVPVLTSSGSCIVYRDCSKLDSSQIDDSRIGAVSNKLSAIRLLRYVPGELLKDVSVLTPDLLFDLGQYIGKLDEILKDYKHPRPNDQTFFSWDLVHLSDLKPYILAKYLGSKERETLIMNVYDQYISTVPQLLQKYEKQVIHNDINEGNIIVKKNLNNLADNKWSIAGIIDFGDMCYSFRVFEIATAMSQIITLNFSRGSPRALESVGKLLKGYQSVYPLSGEELDVIYWCIAGRFIQLLVIGSFKMSFEPENKYVMDTEVHIWDVLPKYLKVTSRDMLDVWMREEPTS